MIVSVKNRAMISIKLLVLDVECLHFHGKHQPAHLDSYLHLCVNSHFQCFLVTSFQVSVTQVAHLYSLYGYESVNNIKLFTQPSCSLVLILL